MRTSILITTLIVVILSACVITGCFSGTNNRQPVPTAQAVAQNTKAEPVCREVQVPYETEENVERVEEYEETVPYTEQECETKLIAYKVVNYSEEYQNCMDYDFDCKVDAQGKTYDCVQFCIKKGIMCCAIIENFDEENKGKWIVDIGAVDRANSFNYNTGYMNYVAGPFNQTGYIKPLNKDGICKSMTVESTSKGGNADKLLSCVFTIKEEATKQICEDVTKYREENRQKKITETRPVTKYMTETVCE